jgi:hypothetical protein
MLTPLPQNSLITKVTRPGKHKDGWVRTKAKLKIQILLWDSKSSLLFVSFFDCSKNIAFKKSNLEKKCK